MKKILNIIKEEIFNFDPYNNIYDKHELEDLERQLEGKLSFEQFAYLTPWLWRNGEINEKTIEHDNLESKKIPRLRYSSIGVFKDVIFKYIRIDNNNLTGFNKATDELAKIFRIDNILSKIELGKLIKDKLKFNILN